MKSRWYTSAIFATAVVGVAAGCGDEPKSTNDGGGGADLVCSSGLQLCDGICVDTRTNNAHCGQCSVACVGGQYCANGVCSCPAGLVQCPNGCKDTLSDPAACGGCNLACGAGQSCVSGVCTGGAGTGATAGTGGVAVGTGGVGGISGGTGGVVVGTGGVVVATGGTGGVVVATGGTGGVVVATGGTGGVTVGTGGATGGAATGGATGGAATGGAPTGGTPTGGAPTGGAPTGGTPTGGAPTGGSGGSTSNCGVPITRTYSGSAGEGQFTQLGAIEVEGGTTVAAVMTGTGDADLYVRIGSEPTISAYDCRPYHDDCDETCTVEATGDTTVYVAVAGYETNTYRIELTYSPRCCTDHGECDDGNPCTTDRCEAEVCTQSHNTDSCDDGNACTENDACLEGACTGSPLVCPEGQVCVDGECEESPELTLFTTCVQDDLDPEDRAIMEQEMIAIGYTAIGDNTNVSTAALNELLGRTDITTLYHTGHGDTGTVVTSDGALYHGQANTINIPNVIFATCLSLTENWSDKMGATSENVLGYTDLSYDGIDSEVAWDVAQSLGQGSSYIRAWYSANVSQSYLSDRWCGYTREAGGVVEYSARSGSVPAASYSGSLEQIDPKIWVASDLLADARTFQSEFAPQEVHEYVVAGDEDHLVQFRGDPREFLTKAPLTSDRAVQVTAAWLGAKLPVDASLEAAHAVKATVGPGAPTTAAYRVRYERVIDGMPVLSNGRVHHIEVVVDAGGVAATSKLWPVLDVFPASSSLTLLGVDVAFASAIDEIRMLVKKPVTIVDVMPCYGSTDSGEIVPAYAFLDTEGRRVVVNARSGDLVF